MKWTELWDDVVRMLWHCKHDNVEQCCSPSEPNVRCLQVCVDCGSRRWLPDVNGWRHPRGLTELASTMPISNDLMEPPGDALRPGVYVAHNRAPDRIRGVVKRLVAHVVVDGVEHGHELPYAAENLRVIPRPPTGEPTP